MEPNGTTPPNPQETEGQEPIGGQAEPVGGTQGVEEPRLFAGRYKTPEELEEGYKQSSNEGKRLFQEVQRLNAIVQSFQKQGTPQQGQPQGKQGGYDGFFDVDTLAALKWLINGHLTEYSQARESESEFQRQVSAVWEETKKEYPDLNDQNSELFQLADKILFERGLASRNDKGQLILITPYAYRIAVDTAYAQLSKQTPTRTAQAVKKGQATAVSGRATSGYVPTGRLTDEQYNKLTDEQKDAYDAWCVQNKIGKTR